MMKIGLILLLSGFVFSCGRIENSSSQDKASYSPLPGGGSDLHNQAIAILSAKCATCHASWLPYTDAEFVATGLVVAANPTGSKVYYRNTLGPGPMNNMPNGGGPAMTTGELQTISDWINSITP